jgi:hypothetical protein
MKVLIILILAIFTAGCAGKAAPVKTAPAPAKPAAQEQKPAAAPAQQAQADYLDAGIKIAAVQLVSWEDTAFMAKAYPVKIAQQASAQTENKHFVEPVVPVEGEKNYGSDLWKWTPFVFNSRPAKKEDLGEGKFVLCVDLDRPLSAAELKKAVWRLRKVSGTSKLFQNLVEVSFYDTYFHMEKRQLVNLTNVRIVEDTLDEKALAFKK